MWILCKVWFYNDHVRKIFCAKCSKNKMKLSSGNKRSFIFIIHLIEIQNWQRVQYVLHRSRNEKIFKFLEVSLKTHIEKKIHYVISSYTLRL